METLSFNCWGHLLVYYLAKKCLKNYAAVLTHKRLQIHFFYSRALTWNSLKQPLKESQALMCLYNGFAMSRVNATVLNMSEWLPVCLSLSLSWRCADCLFHLVLHSTESSHHLLTCPSLHLFSHSTSSTTCAPQSTSCIHTSPFPIRLFQIVPFGLV